MARTKKAEQAHKAPKLTLELVALAAHENAQGTQALAEAFNEAMEEADDAFAQVGANFKICEENFEAARADVASLKDALDARTVELGVLQDRVLFLEDALASANRRIINLQVAQANVAFELDSIVNKPGLWARIKEWARGKED